MNHDSWLIGHASCCRLPWTTRVDTSLDSVVKTASTTLSDDEIRQILDWLLHHPRMTEARYTWMRVSMGASPLEAAAMLRAYHMAMHNLHGLAKVALDAFVFLEPSMSASIPRLLHQSTQARMESGKSSHAMSAGWESDEAARVFLVRPIIDGFKQWIQSSIDGTGLLVNLSHASHKTPSPLTQLFIIAATQNAPFATIMHMFEALVCHDVWEMAAAYYTATSVCSAQGAINLLHIFDEACIRGGRFEVIMDEIFLNGQWTQISASGRVQSVMRACLPLLMSKALGSSGEMCESPIPPVHGASEILARLCSFCSLNEEVFGIWKCAGEGILGVFPYHPAMCA